MEIPKSSLVTKDGKIRDDLQLLILWLIPKSNLYLTVKGWSWESFGIKFQITYFLIQIPK